MDNELSVGGTTTVGTAETETPVEQTGSENADSGNNDAQDGSPQGGTEDGQRETGNRRKWSMQDEVRELRAQRRELRQQLESSGQMREELRQLREEMSRRNQPDAAKAPSNFWQDPEAALDSRLNALRDELTKGLSQTFHQTREAEFQQQALRQEQASAAEYIRSQPGYNSADDDDLIEIIETIPKRQHLSPQMVAEFAWMKLQGQRGIGDKSLQKQRASGVRGQPPGVGFGRKVWSHADFDAALDMIDKDRNNPKHAELLKELELANKEGRVK